MRVGDLVPSLTAPGLDRALDLASRRGRWLVLYFYPKDSTSGCTLEGREFSAARDDFAAAGADVVGVSRDSLASHRRFRERFGVTVELVSDGDEALCQLFGVIRAKVMYGRPARGVERSTFLIDPAGRLAREWRGVRPAGHAAEVLAALRELRGD